MQDGGFKARWRRAEPLFIAVLGILAVALVVLGVRIWRGGDNAGGDDPVAGASNPAVTPSPLPGVSAAPSGSLPSPSASAALPTLPPITPPTAPVAPAPEVSVGDNPEGEDPSIALDAEVSAAFARLTVEQRVGQLFTVAVVGNDAEDPSPAARTANAALFGVETPAEVVERFGLGGIILLDHDQGEGTSNTDDVLGVANFTAGLQRVAAATSGVGLLVGVDQEGGRVVRLHGPATVMPAARVFGDQFSISVTQQAARVTGAEMRALGVNWVYAPVADVNINPDNPVIGDRSFGSDVQVVTAMAGATAAGLQESGVLPTLKHFPGHGDTTVDSHSSLPTIDHDRATLDTVDLPPFRLGTVDVFRRAVMVGHLAVPALDPSGVPATLSPAIVNVLRRDLGFSGLVVTDAMNMGALEGFGDAGTLAVRAINSGIDVVLMPTDLPAAYAAVLAAVRDNTIPLHLFESAVRRVLVAKQEIGILHAGGIAPGDPSVVGAPEHRAFREELAAQCSC